MSRLVSVLGFIGFIQLLKWVGVSRPLHVGLCLIALLAMMGFAYYEGLRDA